MKNSNTARRLSAAVLASAIAFTSLGLASPAFAAPGASAPGVEAASYAETLTANVISSSGTGYGVESIFYTLDAYAGDDHILTGENVFHAAGDDANHSRAFSFNVKLTDQPQVITQLVAKHKDNLAGADRLVQLVSPLVVPAYQPWPPSVLTDEIVMPEIKLGVDEKGYTTFSYDASEIGTTSPDLEREYLHLGAWIGGEKFSQLSDEQVYRCDEPGSIFDGAKVELRAMYTSKTDGTARHNSVIVDCPASIPLALKLGQETTAVKPGETVAFTIDEVAGTYGLKDPVISWSVDGKTVEGATGLSFQAPDTAFTAIQASVKIEDRGGEKLTRTVGWANPTPGTGGGTDEPDTEKPGTKPETPDTGKPDTGKPDTGVDIDKDDKPGKPDTGDNVDKDDSDSPFKSECEGLCDRGDGPSKPADDKDIIDAVVSKKPLTGFKKPRSVGIDNPRVMSSLVK